MDEYKDIIVGDKTFVYSYVTRGYVEYIPPKPYDEYLTPYDDDDNTYFG